MMDLRSNSLSTTKTMPRLATIIQVVMLPSKANNHTAYMRKIPCRNEAQAKRLIGLFRAKGLSAKIITPKPNPYKDGDSEFRS